MTRVGQLAAAEGRRELHDLGFEAMHSTERCKAIEGVLHAV